MHPLGHCKKHNRTRKWKIGSQSVQMTEAASGIYSTQGHISKQYSKLLVREITGEEIKVAVLKATIRKHLDTSQF